MQELKETVPPQPAPAGNHGAEARIAVGILNHASNAVLVVLVGNILAAMTGNAALAQPNPTLAVVAAARDAFVAKIDAAAGGGRVATQQCRDARTALVKLVRNLALNVQQASGGDRAVLLSSGFPLRKARQVPSVLAAPGGLRLQATGNSGQLLARCPAVKAARAYQWRVANAQAPTAFTASEATPHAKYLLANLAPGTQYLAQARVLGALGWSDWCDAVSAIAN